MTRVIAFTKRRRIQLADAERWVAQTKKRYAQICADGASEAVRRCAADAVIERLERYVVLLGGVE